MANRDIYAIVKGGVVTEGGWLTEREHTSLEGGAVEYRGSSPTKPLVGYPAWTIGIPWAQVPVSTSRKARKGGDGKMRRVLCVRPDFAGRVPGEPPAVVRVPDLIRRAHFQLISEARLLRLLGGEDVVEAPTVQLPGAGTLVTLTRWTDGEGDDPVRFYGGYDRLPDGVDPYARRRLRVDLHLIRRNADNQLEHATLDEDNGRFKRWGLL